MLSALQKHRTNSATATSAPVPRLSATSGALPTLSNVAALLDTPEVTSLTPSASSATTLTPSVLLAMQQQKRASLPVSAALPANLLNDAPGATAN